MLFRQAKLSSPEHSYDSKQRLIGGIVLFLLMMFLYLILKAVLGISSTGAAAALRAPFSDAERALSSELPSTAAAPGAHKPGKPKYPLVEKFIFLDLNAKPMGKGSADLANFAAGPGGGDIVNASLDELDDHAAFIVQVASFKERARADKLVEKLKTSGLESTIEKSGRWYVIKLEAEKDRRVAEQHLRTLRGFGIRGIIVEP